MGRAARGTGRPARAVSTTQRVDALHWTSVVGIWLTFAGSAFLMWPWGQEAHSPLRLVALATLMVLTVLSPRVARLPGVVVLLVLTSLAAAAVAAIGGTAPVAQLIGRYPRYEGLPLLLGYAAAMLAGARLVAGAPAAPRVVERVLTVSVTGLAVVAAVEQVVGVDRVMTTVGNASAAGVWGATSLPILLYRWARTSDRWAAIGTVASLVLVGLSASRGALLGAAVGVVAVVVLIGVRQRTVLLRVGGAAALLVLLALVLPATRARVVSASPYAAATAQGRRLLWGETVSLVREHPVLGVGPSGFVDAIGRHHDVRWQTAVGPLTPPDSPHDLPLQVLASTGVVGAALVLALVSTIAVLLVRRVRSGDAWAPGVLASSAAAGTAYAFHFTDVSTTVPVMFLLGSAIGVTTPQPRPWVGRGVAVATLVGAAGIAALGVSGLVAETALGGAGRTLVAGGATSLGTPGRAVRPWDADLDRRWGHALVSAAAAGGAEPRAALPPLERARARLPDSVEVLLDLGEARDLSGDLAGSLDAYRAAARLDPSNTQLALQQGVVLAELGRTQEAEAAFRRVVELRPEDTAPWLNLERLGSVTGDDALVAEARRALAALAVPARHPGRG